MANITRKTTKAILASAILAGLSAGVACAPATAQAIPRGVPFTCNTGGATATSQWINQGNRLILSLEADPPDSVTPAVVVGSSEGQAGVLVENINLPLREFSFDYNSTACNGTGNLTQGLLVTVHSTEGWLFYQYCFNFNEFPARNGWHHVVFTRNEMFTPSEKPLGGFSRISIDLVNFVAGSSISAQVKNFAIDRIPVRRATTQSTGCVSL
jgi:hypothetical protein